MKRYVAALAIGSLTLALAFSAYAGFFDFLRIRKKTTTDSLIIKPVERNAAPTQMQQPLRPSTAPAAELGGPVRCGAAKPNRATQLYGNISSQVTDDVNLSYLLYSGSNPDLTSPMLKGRISPNLAPQKAEDAKVNMHFGPFQYTKPDQAEECLPAAAVVYQIFSNHEPLFQNKPKAIAPISSRTLKLYGPDDWQCHYGEWALDDTTLSAMIQKARETNDDHLIVRAEFCTLDDNIVAHQRAEIEIVLQAHLQAIVGPTMLEENPNFSFDEQFQ